MVRAHVKLTGMDSCTCSSAESFNLLVYTHLAYCFWGKAGVLCCVTVVGLKLPYFFFVCFLPAALVLCHPSIPTRQLIQFPSHQSTLCRPVTSLDKSEGKVFLLGCARTKKHSPVSHPLCL